jgi:outer membrane protein assembly factor BamB
MKYSPLLNLSCFGSLEHSSGLDSMRKILSRLLTVLFIFSLSLEAAESEHAAFPASEITDSSFKANWGLAQNAISHRLDVALDGSFALFVPGFEDLNVGNATTWLVGGLDSGVTYYYRIRALYSEGDPTQSNTVYVSTPSVPGEQKWVFETTETPIGRLALTEAGAIIFAAENGFLYSVNSENGIQNWRTQLGLTSKARPSIGSDGVIFISGYAINSETGTVIWQNGLSGNEISIGPDHNLILNSGDAIRAINAETGNVLWAFDQASDLIGGSISEQLFVYFAGTHFGEGNIRTFKMFAVDYLTGEKAWEYELDSPGRSSPIVGEDGSIYCPTQNELVVLNASGSLLSNMDSVGDSLIITEAGDLVGNFLRSINLGTGAENWAKLSGQELPESVFEPIIGDDGTIYAPMLAGGLWAFDSDDGSTKWSFFQTGNDWPIYGPIIGHDGTVFYGTSYGEVPVCRIVSGLNRRVTIATPATALMIISFIHQPQSMWVMRFSGSTWRLDQTPIGNWKKISLGYFFPIPKAKVKVPLPL